MSARFSVPDGPTFFHQHCHNSNNGKKQKAHKKAGSTVFFK